MRVPQDRMAIASYLGVYSIATCKFSDKLGFK